MAFERLRTSTALDNKLGKPAARSDVPWFSASAKQNARSQLRKKAQLVRDGSGRFTSDEIHSLLADWVLSNE